MSDNIIPFPDRRGERARALGMSRPIRVGDRVRLYQDPDLIGTVIAIKWITHNRPGDFRRAIPRIVIALDNAPRGAARFVTDPDRIIPVT